MKWINFNWTKQKIQLYFMGCIIFSFGAKFFIDSNLGTDPLDVLVLGIVKHIGLTIGIVSGLIAIVFLFIWSIWNRKFPPVTPFFTMFLVGTLIDIWNLIKLEKFTQMLFSPYFLMLIGLLFAAYGSSLIIMSGIGIRTMDLLAITIVHKWKWHFFYAKMIFEVFFFLSGWLLGGPVGVGTIAFVATVGPGMVFFISLNEKYLGWRNFGLTKEISPI
ncbi:YczE/YyaS/YitT family protein [Bacillus cereus]|uniref:YczE/YyaS/YitT family protein n=1 Tax=Bacillus cereus TaxID=1396 RepID=UPI00065B4B42|nr:membrane protein [Bacillus cereus]KMQ32157.1 membrane protein [Bacillus cereus]